MEEHNPAVEPREMPTRAVRVVALFELLKGVVVIGAGFGLLTLLHRDVRQLAVALVTRLHLNPLGHGAGLFVDAASKLTDARMWTAAGLALAYSTLRAVEAWGLWFGHRWAAWLGILGGLIYLPPEIEALRQHLSVIRVVALLINLLVVAALAWALKRRHHQHG